MHTSADEVCINPSQIPQFNIPYSNSYLAIALSPRDNQRAQPLCRSDLSSRDLMKRGINYRRDISSKVSKKVHKRNGFADCVQNVPYHGSGADEHGPMERNFVNLRKN